ncbi:hypothetical protein OH799_01380 [Nocardia sp. NBC_00881]|uniref:hypothetical protein n=1 Tax=Nocardia sp. NBC_00881 TaxID=2975995 RepID=UPI00386E00FA|nr:hypothetical protein OH799_01380 [Nocardia sp. NBC_00881]
MHRTLNLPITLLRIHDETDHHLAVSTDGRLVRLLILDTHAPQTRWCSIDLDRDDADTLAAGLATRHRPRPIRPLARWLRTRNIRR